MVLSKLDLVVIAGVAIGLLWIEHHNRVFLGTPAAAEAAAPASVCPEKDSAPFDAACIAFIGGSSIVRPQRAAPAAAPEAPSRADSHTPACPPSNENAPYSPRCLKFLSGWFWQAAPPANQPITRAN